MGSAQGFLRGPLGPGGRLERANALVEFHHDPLQAAADVDLPRRGGGGTALAGSRRFGGRSAAAGRAGGLGCDGCGGVALAGHELTSTLCGSGVRYVVQAAAERAVAATGAIGGAPVRSVLEEPVAEGRQLGDLDVDLAHFLVEQPLELRDRG